MKREVTRTTRALIASIVAMVLCCAMLIGTTYAWFTDVSSASVSDIHSGNLRAELYKVIGNAEIKVNEETNLFDENVLWELGHTEVAYLKVSNEGNLDLKYRLTINVTNKTIGKTHDGADIDLSQYLRFAVIETASQYSSGDARRSIRFAADLRRICFQRKLPARKYQERSYRYRGLHARGGRQYG